MIKRTHKNNYAASLARVLFQEPAFESRMSPAVKEQQNVTDADFN